MLDKYPSMQKTSWRETIRLWLFCFLKIPMIFWVRPKIMELSDERAIISIALNRRTKNHLGSMYFGALSVGADIAGGAIVMHVLKDKINQISFVFKDFQAQFIKRPEADVHFSCNDGLIIAETIKKALQSKSRENILIHVTATTPSLSGDEPVATFSLTLSLKLKESR